MVYSLTPHIRFPLPCVGTGIPVTHSGSGPEVTGSGLWSEVVFVRGPTASFIGVPSLSHIAVSFPCESTSKVPIECTPRTAESFTFRTPDGVTVHSACPPPLAGEWVDGMAAVGSELRFGGSRVVGRFRGSDPRESGREQLVEVIDGDRWYLDGFRGFQAEVSVLFS